MKIDPGATTPDLPVGRHRPPPGPASFGPGAPAQPSRYSVLKPGDNGMSYSALLNLPRETVSLDRLREIPASGAYLLVLRLDRPARIHTGRHGRITLRPATYLYAGRATRGLPQRLARHRERNKIIHWHIDHLTTRPRIIFEEILVLADQPFQECELVRRMLISGRTRIALPRFGNGDCTEGCPSHLLVFSTPREGPPK